MHLFSLIPNALLKLQKKILNLLFTYKLVYHVKKKCHRYLDKSVYPSKWLFDVLSNGIRIEKASSCKTTKQILLSN